MIRFGVFELDPEAGELRKSGVRLKLAEQPVRILLRLLERPGEIVTREDLRDALWGEDTFVDFEHGLNAAINRLREALGDSAANPRFVETVPRRGYRFIAPVDLPVPVQTPSVPETAGMVPASPSRKIPSRTWVGAGAATAVVVVIAGLILFRTRPVAPIEYKLTQLTRDSGLTYQPSISSDGNFVVYASDRATGKDLDLWIQHVSGGPPVRLTSSHGNEFHPSISADGRKVAFQVAEERGIFVVPALGGTPKLVAAVGQAPQISPDGTSVAYSTGFYSGSSEIYVVPAEGGPARKVSVGLNWAIAPTWTQDGRHLLLWSGVVNGPLDYWMVPASGGTPMKTAIADRLRDAGTQSMLVMPFSQDPSPVAVAGGGGVVIAARSRDGHDLWLTPLSGGKASSSAMPITVGALAANPSVAATGRIAFSRLSVNSGLWMLPIKGSSGRVTGEMRRVWRENVSVAYPNVSTDGKKLAYVSNRLGNPDVWVRDLETGADRQLTSSKADEFRAIISPNGGRVAYAVKGNFYIIPSTSGVERLVCEACGPNVVGWSPDERKLVYYWGNPVRHATFDITTGQKRDVVWHPTADVHNGRISPDGRWITFTLVSEGSRVIYAASLDNGGGGKPESWIRISGDGLAVSSFWSRDGNLIYFHQEDALWARKLRPNTKMPIGETILVKRFDRSTRPLFSSNGVTKDSLYFMMEQTTANVWLAEPPARQQAPWTRDPA